MENYFSIGEVSRYQNISKQTLIFYDKIGLFRPAYVDPDNGYRYYSASQIDQLDTILIMKRIGFSLKEIREHMQHYNIDSSLAAFRRQVASIDPADRGAAPDPQPRAAPLRADGGLQGLLPGGQPRPCGGGGRAAHPLPRRSPALYAQGDQHRDQTVLCGLLPGAAADLLSVRGHRSLAHILAGRYTEATVAFLSIEETDRAPNVRRLPAGTCASLCHVGDYPSIGRSYRKLLQYCADHALKIVSDSHEFCINDYITSRDEAEYITKIEFYVERA